MKIFAKILLFLFYVTVLGIAYQTLASDAQTVAQAAQAATHAPEDFTWSVTTLAMCGVGVLTHLTLAWAEDRKNAPVNKDGSKLSAIQWVQAHTPETVVAVLGAAAGYVLLPNLTVIPGLGDLIGEKITFGPFGAYAVGLVGSFVGKKVMALLTPKTPPNP